MTELTYIKHGDYYYPNLTVGDQPTTPLGKYGRMRRTYTISKFTCAICSRLFRACVRSFHLA